MLTNKKMLTFNRFLNKITDCVLCLIRFIRIIDKSL